MASEFSRIITLLRKEKGVTQKQAAEDLGVSQALLSHYEKGIRECGLEFVVRVADYYGVSCDYLLGRSADRTGLTMRMEDLPGPESAKDGVFHGSVLPVFNKKLISNSLNILYDKLNACPNKGLVGEISAYLMLAVYKMFRLLYAAGPKNAPGLFSVKKELYRRGHAHGRGERQGHPGRRGRGPGRAREGHVRLLDDDREPVGRVPAVRLEPVQPDQDERGAHRDAQARRAQVTRRQSAHIETISRAPALRARFSFPAAFAESGPVRRAHRPARFFACAPAYSPPSALSIAAMAARHAPQMLRP